MGLVWDHYPEGGGELLTALALADHADHDGGGIHPGVRGLSHKTRQSERTIQYHLGRMRKTDWLQPVRYWQGGYGRATEYRINPSWINDPASFAPFKKGAMHGNQGCKMVQGRVQQVAPQPSVVINNKKTPTTVPAKSGTDAPIGGGGQGGDFFVHDSLTGERLPSTFQLISQCPVEHRQAVLDEVAAIITRGALRGNPIGLLARLASKAAQGTFVPAYGIGYAKARRQRLDAAASPEADQAPRAGEAQRRRAAALVAIAKIKQQLATTSSGAADTHTRPQIDPGDGVERPSIDAPITLEESHVQGACDS